MYALSKVKISPSRSLSHDVAVEGVEDALVGQLKRVVQHFFALGRLEPSGIAGRGSLGHFLLGNLAQS